MTEKSYRNESAEIKQRKGVKLTLLLLSMLTIMAAGTIAPSMPIIAAVFDNIPNSTFLSKLLLTIPALFIALTAPFAGLYIDKKGRLKLLYFSLLLYAISGSSGFYLNNIYLILVGRAFLGISIGIIMTITLTFIGDYFIGEERKKFIGYQSAFIGISGVLFLMLGGFLADISWRIPFLIYLFPVLLMPLVYFFLVEPKRSLQSSKINFSKLNPLVIFLWVNGLFIMILMYMIPTQIPFYIQSIGIESKAMSGSALALHALGVVLSALMYAQLKSKLSFPSVFSLAFIIMGLGYLLCSRSESYKIILVAVFVSGVGFGWMIANTNYWIIEASLPDQRGRILGILTSFLFIGQFLSPIITEPIVRASNLSMLFFIAALLMILVSLIYLLLGKYFMDLYNKNIA